MHLARLVVEPHLPQELHAAHGVGAQPRLVALPRRAFLVVSVGKPARLGTALRTNGRGRCRRDHKVVEDDAQVGHRQCQRRDLILRVQGAAADDVQCHALGGDRAQLRELGGVERNSGGPQERPDADHARVLRQLVQIGEEMWRADFHLRDQEREEAIALHHVQHGLVVVEQRARLDDSGRDDPVLLGQSLVLGGQDIAVQDLVPRRRPRHAAWASDLVEVDMGVGDGPLRSVGGCRGPEGTAQDERGQGRRGNDELPQVGVYFLTHVSVIF